MIKLKNLLKESYVWERKFGEKLPTLADVQKKKNEGKLNEKKELNPKQIQAIGVLTQRNEHNVSRALVAKDLLKNKQLYDAYMKIDDLADFFGSLPKELFNLRMKMDKKYLEKGLKAKYSNWKDLWSEL